MQAQGVLYRSNSIIGVNNEIFFDLCHQLAEVSFALQSELLYNKRIDMINLFFRNRRKGENALDLSEIKIIASFSELTSKQIKRYPICLWTISK